MSFTASNALCCTRLAGPAGRAVAQNPTGLVALQSIRGGKRLRLLRPSSFVRLPLAGVATPGLGGLSFDCLSSIMIFFMVPF